MQKIEENWLNGFSSGSRRVYERNWNYFKEFSGLNAEQIIEARQKEEINVNTLFAFQKWLKQEKGLSDNTAKTAIGTLRGFLDHNRMQIYLTRGEKTRLYNTARSTTDYKFTRKDIASMAMVGDLDDQYILLFGKSVGLRANDFLGLTYGDFRKLDLDQPAPVYMGEYVTQKRKVKANPFIDCDSLPVVKAILKRDSHKKDTDRIVTVRSSELTVKLKRISEKAKISTGNDRVRFHCLRKWLITRISATMSESQWKQIVGKKIDESAYVSTDMLLKAYKNALKDLSVMGYGNGNSAKLDKLQKELEESQKKNQLYENLMLKALGGQKQVTQQVLQNKQNLQRMGALKDIDLTNMTTTQLLYLYNLVAE